MAGQLCTGAALKSAVLKDSKAFCEGMAYRTTGYGDVATKDANPHTADTDAAVAWDAGWDVANDAAESTIAAANAGCCALVGAAVPAEVTP